MHSTSTTLGTTRSSSGTTAAFNNDSYMALARAMQHCLEVKDRTYHLKVYKDCFVGTDAVDFIVDYLKLPSREAALKVGQDMNAAVHCLEHVVHDHDDQLKDEKLFYRFTDFSAKRSFTLPEVMRAFQMGVRVEDRTYRLRTYQNVFVGREAVDFLVNFKFAASRLEALELGRKLEREYELFVHVTGEHKLEDDYIFYRMLTPKMGKSKQVKAAEKKALQNWICVFTIVALVLYYKLF